jgi:hypothetical protein
MPSPVQTRISTQESLPDMAPVSPMDPKLLEDDGLVLNDCLFDFADAGRPFSALKSLFPEPGRDLSLISYLVLLVFVV